MASAVKLSEKSRQLLELYLQLKAQLEEEKKREIQGLLALRDLALQLLKQIDEEIQRLREAPSPRSPAAAPAQPTPTQQPPSGPPTSAGAAPAAGGGSRRGFEALA